MCKQDVQLLRDCATQLAVSGTAWERDVLKALGEWFYVPRGPDAEWKVRRLVMSTYVQHATGGGVQLWVGQAAEYLLDGQFQKHEVL